jgi:putative ABC transport system permease protein
MFLERWWYVLRLRVRSLVKRDRVDRELDDELSYHIEQATEANVAQGLSAREAKTAALRRFGGVAQRREDCRDEQRLGWLDNLRADLRYAVRMAVKTPWMTTVCVVALGVAMAVTIGGFSLLWATYFADLPFEHGDRIVAVRDIRQPDPETARPTLGMYRTWERLQTSFDRFGAADLRSQEVSDGAEGVVRYPVAVMTASGFDLAGVQPLHGRVLQASDEAPGATPVVVVGYRVWHGLFGGDPSLVDKTVNVDGENLQVVGIMPDGFRFPISEDLWVPLTRVAPGDVAPPLLVFGRLADGVTTEQAGAQLEVLRRGYAATCPEDLDLRDRLTTVIPYVRVISSPGDEALVIGIGVFFLLVLVVACGSVANLLLARALVRSREIAVRGALGASRRRLVAQLSIEALLLTTAGASLAVAISQFTLGWLSGMGSVEGLPFWIHWHLSVPSALFAVAIALGATVVAGAIPAFKATGVATHAVLKDGAATASNVRFGALSGALTVAEVTLSVAFLAAAALTAQSLLVAGELDETLPTREVLVARVAMVDEWAVADPVDINVPADVISPAQWPIAQEELRTAVAALPGVRSASLVTRLPGQVHRQTGIELEREIGGAPATAGSQVLVSEVSPEMFEIFGATVLAGRTFGPSDSFGTEPVAVVNASFVRRFYGSRSPVDTRFRAVTGNAPSTWTRIIGVTSDLPLNPGAGQTDGYYIPFAQRRANNFTLALHVTGDPLAMTRAVTDAAARVDPRLDVTRFETHETLAARVRTVYQLLGLALVALGGTAALLSVAGLYAVMAFAVAQRTREIGIRRALGADHRGILAVVLRRGLTQVGAGIVLGSAAGWALLGLMQFFPTGVASRGTGQLVAAAVIMLIAGLFACIVPASRAVAVHPVEALRQS